MTEYDIVRREGVAADQGLSLRVRLFIAFLLVALLPGLLCGIILWSLDVRGGQARLPRLLGGVGGVGLGLAIMLLSLVLAGAVAFLITQRLLKRLQRLTTTATEIAAGDMVQRLPVDREDEIGRLAAALNRSLDRAKALGDAASAGTGDEQGGAPAPPLPSVIQELQLADWLVKCVTQPMDVMGSPVNITGSPVNITGSPVDITGSPVDAAQPHPFDDWERGAEGEGSRFDCILRRAADAIVTRSDFSRAALYFVDDGHHALHLKAAAHSEGYVSLEDRMYVPLDSGDPVAEAFVAEAPRLDSASASTGDQPDFLSVPRPSGANSSERPGRIVLPLSVAGQTTGVLALDTPFSDSAASIGSMNAARASLVGMPADGGARYVASEEGAASLQIIADQIGLALTYARALDEAHAHLRELSGFVRRERQEAWKAFLSDKPQGSWAYVYDGVDVRLETGADGVKSVEPDLELPFGPSDAPLGHIRMISRTGRSLDIQDIALARTVSEEAGDLLLRAQSREQVQVRLHQAEQLYRCSRAMIQARSPRDVLSAIADSMQILPHQENGEVGQISPDRAWLLLQDVRGAGGAGEGSRLRVSAALGEERLLDQMWSFDHLPALSLTDLVVIQDVAEDETLDEVSRETLLHEFGLRSALLLPLTNVRAASDQVEREAPWQGEALVGWLIVGAHAYRYRFSEHERAVYGSLADVAGTMLWHLQSLEQAVQRARRTQLVGNISTRVRETLDMDLILQTALREIGENLGVSAIEVQMQRRTQSAERRAQSADDQAQSADDQAQSADDQAQSADDQAQPAEDQVVDSFAGLDDDVSDTLLEGAATHASTSGDGEGQSDSGHTDGLDRME